MFVTHDINEALFLGQRVMIMHEGGIVQFATPEEIVRHPATEFVEQLLERFAKIKICGGNNMIEYWNENWPIMLDDVRQHATMVLSSLVIALVIAVIIILLFCAVKSGLTV